MTGLPVEDNLSVEPSHVDHPRPPPNPTPVTRRPWASPVASAPLAALTRMSGCLPAGPRRWGGAGGDPALPCRSVSPALLICVFPAPTYSRPLIPRTGLLLWHQYRSLGRQPRECRARVLRFSPVPQGPRGVAPIHPSTFTSTVGL